MNGKPIVRAAKIATRNPTFQPNCEPETKPPIAVSLFRELSAATIQHPVKHLG
jgi:hypothetical protein